MWPIFVLLSVFAVHKSAHSANMEDMLHKMFSILASNAKYINARAYLVT